MVKKRSISDKELEDLLEEKAVRAEEQAEVEEQVKQTQIEDWVKDFQERFSEQPAKVQVEKYSDGAWEICRKWPLEIFDHEAVRDEYGGGKYRASLFGPDGKYVKGGRHEFKFAQPLKPSGEKAPDRVNPLSDPVVQLMIENMKSSQTMMLEILKANMAGSGSRGNELAPLIEAMKGIGALAPKEKDGLAQIKEAMGLAASMKNLMGGDKEEKVSSGGIMGDIKDFFEMWPTIKEQLGTLPRPTPSVPVAPGTVTVMPGTHPAGNRPIERNNGMPKDPVSQKIIALVPTFIKAAQANAPIETWSDYLAQVLEEEIMPVLVPQLKEQYKFAPLEITEDTVYDGLLKRAKDPAERMKIFTQIPPLAPYQAWVNQVIDAVVTMFEVEESDTTTTMEVVTPNGVDGKSHDNGPEDKAG